MSVMDDLDVRAIDDTEKPATLELENGDRANPHIEGPDLGIANGSDCHDPADPAQWPKWKKNAQILLIALHLFSATFMAAGIISASHAFVRDYNVTVQQATYLSSSTVCP